MSPERLAEVLEAHRLWQGTKGEHGKRADLSGGNLADANLCGVNLIDANLRCADLTGTDLTGAFLCGTDLRGADLTCANFTGADLTEAYLGGAIWCGATINGAVVSPISVGGPGHILWALTEPQAALIESWDELPEEAIEELEAVIRKYSVAQIQDDQLVPEGAAL